MTTTLPHPQKRLVSAGEMQSLIISDGGIAQRKYDGDMGRLDIGGGIGLLGEKMRRKSGGFYTAADLKMFEQFPDGWFAAFTVETWNGKNMLTWSEDHRITILNDLTLPPGVILAETVHNVADVMDSGAEGVVWRDWLSSWGNMVVHKVLNQWHCRVGQIGGTQSVLISDAKTGEPRGRCKLGGGKIDRVQANVSIIKVEGLGLTEKGFIREPRVCEDSENSWIVSY